jgi:putative ABC transport system permease protein
MTFFQFASNNVRRNMRAYAAYFLSSSFAILMFFLYATLANHPNLQQGYLKESIINGMQIAEYIIFIFAFFFILYSMGTFLKGRTKEFGILTVLGMSNRQFMGTVFLENMLLGLAALCGGVVIGLIGSKLFLLLGSAVFDMAVLPFYIPVQALLITGVAFTTLFLLVSLATMLFIRNNSVASLLKGTRRPKAEPKPALVLALFAAVCLVVGYGLAVSYRAPLDGLGVQPVFVIVLVALGTYFLYTQLSVFLIHLLKKRRRFYWRGTHMLWLSDLAYSMKDNARLFFVIAMILSVTFTATSALALFKSRTSAHVMPFAFTLLFQPGKTAAIAPIEKTLAKTLHDQHFSSIRVEASYVLLAVTGKNIAAPCMSLSDYNRWAAVVHASPLSMQPGEAIEVSTSQPDPNNPPIPSGSTITLVHGQRVHVVSRNSQQVLNEDFLTNVLIVPDQDYQRYSTGLQQNVYVGYSIVPWRDTLTIAFTLQEQTQKIYESTTRGSSSEDFFLLSSHALDYLNSYQIPNITLFVGLFVAIIFLIASSSFLYFRLYSSLTENTNRYRAMMKIGLTSREMRASLTLQMVVLFFVPFMMAIVHTVFAMIVVQNNMHAGTQVFFPTILTIGGFLLFQMVYFLLVRTQYLHQLEQTMM